MLILGASGGVGVCCVQLAKLAGAHVIACAGSEEKGSRLTELGADEIILYTQTDFMKAVYERHGKPHRRRFVESGGVDVVVNFTGGDTWVKSMRCLKLGGRLLTCGATAGYAPVEDLRFIWTFELQILRLQRLGARRHRKTVRPGAGRQAPGPDRQVLPARAGKEAVRVIEDRAVFGKVVVTP